MPARRTRGSARRLLQVRNHGTSSRSNKTTLPDNNLNFYTFLKNRRSHTPSNLKLVPGRYSRSRTLKNDPCLNTYGGKPTRNIDESPRIPRRIRTTPPPQTVSCAFPAPHERQYRWRKRRWRQWKGSPDGNHHVGRRAKYDSRRKEGPMGTTRAERKPWQITGGNRKRVEGRQAGMRV